MAYNNGFPMTYPQQMYYPPQPVQMMQQVPQQPQMQQPQPVQQTQQQYPIVQGGFVRVRNENEARMYPVAPGNSVTFIDETGPYCYCKTVNMGQLDRPVFEKYRLVKEDDAPAPVEAPQKHVEVPTQDLSNYATKADLEAFRADISTLKTDIENFRGDLYGIAGKKAVPKKKEVTDSE